VHCVVGETLRYFTTLVAVPTINISFYLRIYCLFSSFSIVKTIELNLVYRLCLFSLDKIYLGSPYILIGLKVSISFFRSLEPPSFRKGRVGTLSLNPLKFVHSLSIRISQLDQRNRLYALFGFVCSV